MHYKTLYDKVEVKSLKIKQDNPGPGFYNPKPIKAALEKSGPLSSFKSNVNRFKKDKLKTAVPGPGKYNHEVPQEDQKAKTLSYFFKPSSPKKEDILLKYIDDTNKQNLDDISNKEAIDPKGATIYSSGSFGQTKSTFYKTGMKTQAQGFNINFDYNKNFNMTKKDFFNYVNTNYKNAMKNKFNTRTQSAVPLVNLKNNQLAIGRAAIEAKREADYIRTYLGKNNKKPLFELSPPRWKEFRHNKYPGPAYYEPSKPPTKIDFFNDDMSRWI
jgi:hypothetical protein